ncbi:hypothetical protein LSH36_528g02020 [Paralvinella palmiformis]|uniref:Uncharacterized protein n=1 Tax=Paralvinella palmiformis TaxID=53620 RepID=A0AAD9J870_9ANNE|nr:hypothetical protein LSH36_528g02020 [Paralvinella palmiformis]
MAPGGKTYPAPTIPDTPSKAINDMLQMKCDKTFDSPVKFGIAYLICFAFTAVVKIYHTIHHDVRQSHTKWMMASGIFALGCMFGAVILYYLGLACSLLLNILLYYGCVAMALTGLGLSVAGAVFFDKDGTKQSPGFETSEKATNKRE